MLLLDCRLLRGEIYSKSLRLERSGRKESQGIRDCFTVVRNDNSQKKSIRRKADTKEKRIKEGKGQKGKRKKG